MRCHSCGTDVREGQKFCMECGASLRGIADVTGEVPVVRPGAPTPPPSVAPGATGSHDLAAAAVMPSPTVADDDRERHTVEPQPRPPVPVEDTAPLAVTSSALAVPATRTHELTVIDVTEASPDPGAESPGTVVTGQVAEAAPPWRQGGEPDRRRFHLTRLLWVAVLAGGATAIAVLSTVVTITPPPDGVVPEYGVNDFGTNNTIAGVIAASAMIIGALVWCAGGRWGAGLVGGAGAALTGWSTLVLGAAEWRLDLAAPGADATRALSYWALVAAGVSGAVALVGSFATSGRDGRNGLDPWIAALAAVSFLIAAGGPLIPGGGAGWASNWTGDNPGGLPTLFFAGRAVQLGLLAVCGVVGCLLVRRWGLGLAVGGGLAAGWLLVTSATDRTASPIGPGYSNPLFTDNQPHAVTIVGFALAGFFCLVAIVMALLDVDR